MTDMKYITGAAVSTPTYNRNDYLLAERIMGSAVDIEEAATMVAVYRDEFETDAAENVARVHDALAALRQRELQLLLEIGQLHQELSRLQARSEIEKADTIPAPAPYYCEAQGE